MKAVPSAQRDHASYLRKSYKMLFSLHSPINPNFATHLSVRDNLQWLVNLLTCSPCGSGRKPKHLRGNLKDIWQAEWWVQPSPSHQLAPPPPLQFHRHFTLHRKLVNIIKDHFHPNHSVIPPRPLGSRYKPLGACSTRFSNSFLLLLYNQSPEQSSHDHVCGVHLPIYFIADLTLFLSALPQ